MFLFSSLAFSLVLLCRAGFPNIRHTLVKQESILKTSRTFRTKNKANIPAQVKISGEFGHKMPIQPGQRILFHGVKKWFYLNFYLSASQPWRAAKKGAKRRDGGFCTCSSKGLFGTDVRGGQLFIWCWPDCRWRPPSSVRQTPVRSRVCLSQVLWRDVCATM